MPALATPAQAQSSLPAAPASLQAPAGDTNPTAPSGQIVKTAPRASAGLPTAPAPQSSPNLFAPTQSGLLRPAGSGMQFVAPGILPGPGGFAIEKATDGPLPLSLDDAISLGLTRNVRIKYQKASQREVRGYRGQITNAINPNLEFKAASTAQEINLAALGFNPNSLGPALAAFGLTAASFPTIVKVNTTSAQISLNQPLFNVPDYELLRAIKPEFKAVDLNVQDADEQLVQAVVTAYLRVLADQVNLANTVAQVNSARVSLDQATARDAAGIGVRLDVLRAQVEYQQRQQSEVSAENQLDKDGVQLNRIMGLPAGQQLDLTDDTPYTELGNLDLEQARTTAFSHRNDLLALEAGVEVASRELKAVRYQRLPTLAASGFYGILGVTNGSYHGVFTAEGSLKVPVFREAGQRGEEQTAESQLQQLRDQIDGLRGTIDAQIRSSMLDVDTASQLVRVATSNVDLAQQELADARDQFRAGVADNLAVVDAESAVAGAQAQLVNSLYQFNVAKVNLARGTGVLQARYRTFLGM